MAALGVFVERHDAREGAVYRRQTDRPNVCACSFEQQLPSDPPPFACERAVEVNASRAPWSIDDPVVDLTPAPFKCLGLLEGGQMAGPYRVVVPPDDHVRRPL